MVENIWKKAFHFYRSFKGYYRGHNIRTFSYKRFLKFDSQKIGFVAKCETLTVFTPNLRCFLISSKKFEEDNYATVKVSHFTTKPIFWLRNLKRLFVEKRSYAVPSMRTFKDSVEMKSLFTDVLSHLDAILNPSNLF